MRFQSRLQIADWHPRVANPVCSGMFHYRQQSNQATVAPPQHAHSARIDFWIALEHERSSRVHIFNFESTVIDLPPVITAVAAASPVVGRKQTPTLISPRPH